MNLINKNIFVDNMPKEDGFFGEFGGDYTPEAIVKEMQNIEKQYREIAADPAFYEEYMSYLEHYVGRPSPIFHAKRLSEAVGGAQIYLKREDLNHTGAHKINHCIGEVLLAKHMGKKKVIAETGAGQHGVALATAAALFGLECDIYMGRVDVEKQASNVSRMKILGTTVYPVDRGTKTLKDAVDAAFEAYLKDPVNQIYCIGSVVGPHPFPMMVRDFQSVVGCEAKKQFKKMTGKLPDNIVACVGGGSNAMGIFSAFIPDKSVKLFGVEPAGKGLDTPYNAATLTKGEVGILHGSKTFILQDKDKNPLPVYSIASGLDYPGVGPQHSYLKTIKRVSYQTATDREAVEAFYVLSRMEGIVPALESSHAVAYATKLAKTLSPDQSILVNLSGRGDKDVDFIMENYPLKDYESENSTGDHYQDFMNRISEHK